MPTSPPTERIGAWILAGGLSTRFGSDKASFLVGDETLLARTARVCTEAGLAPTVVARHERPGSAPSLIEADAPHHPLHGVATALTAAAGIGHAWALLIPCDLPSIEAADLARLLRARAEAGRPVYAAAVRLLCVLPSSAGPAAAAIASRGGSVRELLAEVGALPVELGPVENLNRPA